MTKIFPNWQPKNSELFSKHIVKEQHSLHQHELFTDDALAKLIEKTPRSNYHVNTHDLVNIHKSTWRDGEFGDLSGKQVLQAVRDGHIWINIQKPWEADPAYGEVLDQMFEEFEANVSDFSTFHDKNKMTILISSPKIKVFYHCDIPGQALWQIRGRKRVYIYPNTAPFLKNEEMEQIILGRIDEHDITYQDWYDDYAEIIDLEPGVMSHWPINGPHRIENLGVMNVSITTEHWNKDLRNHYAVRYANGLLRDSFGFKDLRTPTSGLGLYARLALAGFHKVSGLRNLKKMKYHVDFQVDPSQELGFKDIESYELSK
ncbi:MAG: hypothetical protein HRU29_03180 [Rhizobiales bacterium]|nr:hypothetical protein [Hyphomicrobiales bacterium]NRB13381.1 hypothetical protein [Hyphomicrobiales bacterium]